MEFQSRWWHLAAVQVGGAVCLPIFVLGHALSMKYGLFSALAAVGLGNAVLLVLGFATANFAARTRFTTAESAEDTFGSYGKPLFAFLLIVSMMGWFAIQLDLMGDVAGKLIGIEVTKPLNVILGGMITLFGLRGVKGLEKLANFSLPLMILTIAYAIFEASKAPSIAISDEMVVFGGVSLAIAAAMGAVIDLPTFFRHAKSPKDALIAVVLLFGLAIPLLEGVGIYLASHGASDNLVGSLAHENSKYIWKVWVAIFVILAGWTTNSTNLYSAVTSFRTVLKLRSEFMSHIGLGTLGTALSLFNIQENLFLFLDGIGIMLAGAGGVMLLHQITLGRTRREFNCAGVIFGILGGAVSFMGLEMSGTSFMDAFLIAFAVSAFGCLIKWSKNYETC